MLKFFSSFQNNASKLLLAIMESRGDSENAERILYNMSPKQLVIYYFFIATKFVFKCMNSNIFVVGFKLNTQS